MATNVELAVQLLRNVATFFSDISSQNEEMTAQMNENSEVYNSVANLLESDPDGEISDLDGQSPQ